MFDRTAIYTDEKGRPIEGRPESEASDREWWEYAEKVRAHAQRAFESAFNVKKGDQHGQL